MHLGVTTFASLLATDSESGDVGGDEVLVRDEQTILSH